MIEEVVSSILQAEDKAKEKIAEAEKQASQIIADGELEAEKIKKQCATSIKQKFLQATIDNTESSNAVAQEKLKQLNEITDSQLQRCKDNVDKAVQIVLEYVNK